ncbi:tetratricopeptide repeat protein [Hyphomicrobium sp.]|uniref:tetratricopeptide repeat protein n=1 Tax=Hyphomicrobium sp. TaxID=82 RepID=UPI001DDA1100|nr:tetratricopeptide repeat protein [Hyphomicrobium sp.]MBY0558629.1 tetratricopeptide repeat protein [Hyphomicrobium sp.]
MADNNDSLLREVEEELRREQMHKIWKRYNGLILGGAVLIVLGVAGYQMLEHHRITTAETAGAEFAAAENLSDQKKKDDADKAFKAIAESGPAGYAALAKLQLAGAQVKEGKTADAVATYDSLAKQAGADDLLKSFAQLQAASLRMADADYDEIQNRLTPLTAEGAPFANSARELLGVAAYKAKKFDDARKYLEPLLVDPNVPGDTQERVKIIMSGIAGAEVAAKEPPAATPAVAAEPAKPAEPSKTEAQPAAGGTADKK